MKHFEGEVTKHVKDLRRHNDFLEKHLGLLLVANDKRRASQVEAIDKEVAITRQRIDKLEREKDLERQQKEIAKTNEVKLKTDIIELKNSMALNNRTLEDLSTQIKGLQNITSMKGDIEAMANTGIVNN